MPVGHPQVHDPLQAAGCLDHHFGTRTASATGQLVLPRDSLKPAAPTNRALVDASIRPSATPDFADPWAGIVRQIEESTLSISVKHRSFQEWWEPYTLGVGPAGAYAAGLDATRQAQLRERCRSLLPAAPFLLTARAWAVRGLV